MSNSRLDEQDIEQLLTAAGLREKPADEIRARVYAATLQAWREIPDEQSTYSKMRSPRTRGYLALAASTLIAATVGLLIFDRGDATPTSVGDVVYVHGNYQLDGTVGDQSQPLTVQETLSTKSASLMSLRMHTGAIVTLDEMTTVKLISPHELMLNRGRIYVDTEAAGKPASSLEIHTKYSKIVDIGTQFEVQLTEPATGDLSGLVRVAVREGRVDVVGDSFLHTALAGGGLGEELVMRDAVLVERNVVATPDDRWNWRRAGREPYVLTNSSVYDYLRWMARDSGHELHFASRAVEQMSKIGALRYSEKLTSDETRIEDVLEATRFSIQRPREGIWKVQFRSSS